VKYSLVGGDMSIGLISNEAHHSVWAEGRGKKVNRI